MKSRRKALLLPSVAQALFPLMLLSSDLVSAQSPPATITRTYTYTGGSLTVEFALHPLRGPGFEVYTHSGGSNYATFTPTRPERTYLGTVTGFPGAVAAGQLLGDGSMRTTIIFEDGTTWRGTGTGMTLPSPASWTPKYPSSLIGAGGAGSQVYAADVGLDLTYTYYNKAGQNLSETLERAEWAVMEANAIYLRDAAILHRIGRVIIRTNSGDDRSTSLSDFKTEWESVVPADLPSASYDLAASVVVTGGGGLAHVGSIGTSNRYSWNSVSSSSTDGNFATVWRHEAGHNWGAGHSEGGAPEGSTVMSGNGLGRFSSSDLAVMVSHRNSKAGILDSLGAYPFPLPPRANADRGQVHATGAPNVFDVLANDSDSNGDAIGILSFQSASSKGGSVTRSVGTGPGGRDELIYTPPVSFTSGLDTFTYRIQDATGQQAVAHVMILPSPQEPDPGIVADVTSVGSGDWTNPSVWSDTAAAASGNDYEISSGHTVDSSPNSVGSGGSVAFPGDSLRIATGGTLRLSHNSGGGNNTHTVDLKGLRLETGSTLQSYNSSVGNVSRILRSPLAVTGGTAGIRIQSDSGSAYTNSLRLEGGIFGSGNLAVTGSLQGQSGERRLLQVSTAESTYSGHWTVSGDNTSDNTRRLFLVAEARNCLGTGTVTLNTRAQLRNSASRGLDSLSGIQLAAATSTLQLSQPWNNPLAHLEIQAGTFDLGPGASTIGSLTIGGQAIPYGTYNSGSLAALGYGGSFTGSGTLAVGIPSAASGEWTAAATWTSGLAPAAGNRYGVSSGHTVDSAPANLASGGTITFGGASVTVESGGMLRLRHTSAGGNNTHAIHLKHLVLLDGSAFRAYNTAQGNVVRNLNNPVTLAPSGSVALRIQSDHSNAYTNALHLNGALTGGAHIALSGSLQGVSGERRFLYVNSAYNTLTGNWTVAGDNTTDSARRLFLVANAAHALGSGSVTLNAYAQLRNAAANGIDSLAAVTLASSTSTLHLGQPWNNAAASLIMQAGTLDLGASHSTIGSFTLNGNIVPGGIYSASGLAALGYGGSFTGSGTITVSTPLAGSASQTFDSWAAHYLTGDAPSGKFDDADDDGLVNLIEYLLASNPASGTTENLPRSEKQGDHFVFTFTRLHAPEYETSVEYALSPAGPWTTAEEEMVDTQYYGSTRVVTARIPIPEGRTSLFARLRVAER